MTRMRMLMIETDRKGEKSMNPSYEDITSRIDEPPAWWQEGGVPRWGMFTPAQASSIYATELVLMEIECQTCETRFRVAMCHDLMANEPSIAQRIIAGTLHYGDPPNGGHDETCGSGASMNSVPKQILEYWSTHDPRYTKDGQVVDTEKYFSWKRNALFEGQYDGWNGRARPAGDQ